MSTGQDQDQNGGDVESVDRWRAVLDGVDVEDALEVASLVIDAPPEGLGALLGSVVDGAVEALVAGAAADQFAPVIAQALPRARSDRGATLVSGGRQVAAAVLLEAVGQVGGPAGWGSAREVLDDWVGAARRDADLLLDADRHDLALACLALGRDDTVTDLVGGRVPGFEPGKVFGPDKPSFARYVVAAVAAGAPVGDAVPAWTSFVLDFPAAVQARSLRWSSLVHAGYALYVRLGQRTPDQVMASIKAFVDEVLQMG